MFDTYRDIFQQRGEQYHHAMTRFPQARADELDHIARLTDVRHGDIVCDIPSGGGYINNFLPSDITLVSVETSAVFAGYCRAMSQKSAIVLSSMETLPFQTGALDRVMSLAGLHHVQEKVVLYGEVHRTLKQGGVFCFADVLDQSPPATFLNGFVHEHSSMGHVGEFLTDGTESELDACGFRVISASSRRYRWHFDSLMDMAEFCRLMFGIDRADPERILEGVDRHVGIWTKENQYGMHWELLFCKAVKN
jgi:SAM-dependent methyltransferase